VTTIDELESAAASAMAAWQRAAREVREAFAIATREARVVEGPCGRETVLPAGMKTRLAELIDREKSARVLRDVAGERVTAARLEAAYEQARERARAVQTW
jgi:hypothetical protein